MSTRSAAPRVAIPVITEMAQPLRCWTSPTSCATRASCPGARRRPLPLLPLATLSPSEFQVLRGETEAGAREGCAGYTFELTTRPLAAGQGGHGPISMGWLSGSSSASSSPRGVPWRQHAGCGRMHPVAGTGSASSSASAMAQARTTIKKLIDADHARNTWTWW